jgi:chorismate synthase
LLNCLDENAAVNMLNVVYELRSQGDSVGSSVEAIITGLPLGLGEPWFEGLEPALARALMAIPAARAVEFGRGAQAATMRGSEHNDPWVKSDDDAVAIPSGDDADGALGGLATGAPLRIRIHFKPPSSISIAQQTLNISSGEMETLVIGGRHDPTIGPRAAPVVEGMCRLVIADLLQGR